MTQRQIFYLTLEAPRNGQASYTHIHEIMRGLERRGWTARLFQPSYAAKAQNPPLIHRVFYALAAQARLWLSYKKGMVIYIRAHYLAFPTAVLARLFNVLIVHEVNGPYEDVFVTYPVLNSVRRPLIWMLRTQYKMASRLIGVTEELSRWLQTESKTTRAVTTIPNGANTDIFKPGLPVPQGLPGQYALFFGGLTGWHGIPAILEALKHPSWPDSTKVVVIGDGPERGAIENAAQGDGRILYLGKKPYQDIPAYAGGALCGLVTISNPGGRSDTGLYPLKLFETLACGVPVIVTDYPGQADLVREGRCGIVIKAADAAEIASAVRNFADNPAQAKEMGQRGADLIQKHHSWDERAGRTHHLLLELMGDETL
jgi:glycosyltransferase involved in cell wall biosynthesis